ADRHQEAAGHRKQQVVSEEPSRKEQRRRTDQEGKRPAPFPLQQPGCDKPPDLPEHVGGGREQRGNKSDLHVDQKRLRELPKDDVPTGGEALADRPEEEPQDRPREAVADDEGDPHGDAGSHHPAAQLLEMREKRHARLGGAASLVCLLLNRSQERRRQVNCSRGGTPLRGPFAIPGGGRVPGRGRMAEPRKQAHPPREDSWLPFLPEAWEARSTPPPGPPPARFALPWPARARGPWPGRAPAPRSRVSLARSPARPAASGRDPAPARR